MVVSAHVDRSSDFGTNSWLVEEMYEQFRDDPDSVGEAWQEFFADYKSTNPALQAHAVRPGPRRASTTSRPSRPRRRRRNGATTTARPRRRPP